jgi:hypothetical protein
MKRFEGGLCAAIVALLCGGCGSGPLPTEDSTTGDTVAETTEALQTPTKGRPPIMYSGVASPDLAYSYAATGRNFSDLGLPIKALSGRVTVGKPIVRKTLNDGTSVHSLAEIAGQSFDQLDTVEIGWIVYDDDPNPRLFIFYWIKSVDGNGNPTTIPYCLAGAHYKCNAFKSTSSTIMPDMVLSPGATVTLGMKHVDTGGTAGWHALTRNFGYLPDSHNRSRCDNGIAVVRQVAGPPARRSEI